MSFTRSSSDVREPSILSIVRYSLYCSDPDLQAAHAAFPWILTPDDHEVQDNYADAKRIFSKWVFSDDDRVGQLTRARLHFSGALQLAYREGVREGLPRGESQFLARA